MTTQQLALISPRSHVAALLSQDRASVSILNDCGDTQQVPTDRFVQTNPDFSVVAVETEAEAKDELSRRSENANCLDMFLFLFDASLPMELRRGVSDELEPLLASTDNLHYVQDILLSKPLPKSVDVDGALIASENNPSVNDLVSLVSDSQEQVKLTYGAWLTVEQDPLFPEKEHDYFLGTLIRCGVFRRLACNCKDKASLKVLRNKVCLDPQLKRFPNVPRVISNWFELIENELPDAPTTKYVAEAGEVYPEHDVSLPAFTTPGPTAYVSAHTAYEAAESQITKVVDLFSTGKDQPANKILDQLVSDNLSSGESYAVKSLCNIATKVASRGRDDISVHCLEEALGYPKGIDHVLYFQIGTQLRDAGKLEDAMQCYDKAERLAGGNPGSLERIHTAKIHIHTAKGEYDQALHEYFDIPNYSDKPSVLCSIADLYRKKGLLEKARERYYECLDIEAENDRATAGLAEVWKQKGKFHRAIPVYNKLLSNCTALQDKSRLVYQLALAHLFRLTCQYEKAEGLLLKLHQKAPRHSDINFQLATFYKITGNTSQSQKYCEQAKATSNNNDILRLSLLERVSQQLRDKHDRTNISMEHVLPEDVGLIKCFDAFSSIVDSRPSDAVGLLENVSFVDHIVEDLACVLKFHALTVNHHDVSHIQQHRINVLAKRGDRSLRNAIVAIRRGEYREAQQREAELILRAV